MPINSTYQVPNTPTTEELAGTKIKTNKTTAPPLEATNPSPPPSINWQGIGKCTTEVRKIVSHMIRCIFDYGALRGKTLNGI